MFFAKIIIPNYVMKKQLIQEDFKSDTYKLKIFKFKICLNVIKLINRFENDLVCSK